MELALHNTLGFEYGKHRFVSTVGLTCYIITMTVVIPEDNPSEEEEVASDDGASSTGYAIPELDETQSGYESADG